MVVAAAAMLLSACQMMELPAPPVGGYTVTDTVELHLPPGTSRLHVTAACRQNPMPQSDVSFDLWDSDGKRVQGALCHGTASDPGQAPVDGWSPHPNIRFLYGTVDDAPAPSTGSVSGWMMFTVDAYDANGSFLATIL